VHEDQQTIHNTGTGPHRVWVEPWAHSCDLAPGESVTVIGRSEQEGCFEVVRYDFGTALYGWPGADVQVQCGAEEPLGFPVFTHEGVPDGLTIREFIERVFGGPGGPY
jgi:hypothetical protein